LYSDLYRVWKSEKTSEKTQPLPPDFYERVQTYLKGLEEDSAASDGHTIQGRITLKEKQVTVRLLRELKETRLEKLLTLADRGDINTENLTEEEKTFVKTLDKSLQAFQEGKQPDFSPPQERVELSVVRFLTDIPEIVGTDLKMYGPYKKEDVGSLPNQNAEALIRQGAAREIEVRNIHPGSSKHAVQLHQQ
jgi:DNA replication factor GINS